MASNVQMDDFSMSKHTLNRTMWHSEEKKTACKRAFGRLNHLVQYDGR